MKRICEHCGKPITFGCMTNQYGDFYIHESCFDIWMNKKYGRWRLKPNAPKDGPYYQVFDGDWNDVDIFYTEYTKEDLEDEE